MDRLSIFLTLMVGAVIAGGIVIAAFSIGYYSFWPVVIAAVVASIATWPVSYHVSSRIKRNDPNWHPRPQARAARPDPDAPEI